MNTYQEVEKLLSAMTRAEKAQLLQWVVRDLGDSFPGIESKPEVSGGEACIVRTHIPVWLLEQARRLGTSEAELLRSYPFIRLHQQQLNHAGVIVCTFDPDFVGLAARIDSALKTLPQVSDQLIRVNRLAAIS